MRSQIGPAYDAQDWTYFTLVGDRAFDADFGELHILFVKPFPGGAYQAWDEFGGTGVWPRAVLDAFHYTREAFVEHPMLELPGALRELAI
jgi:hypothetical protein